MRNYPLWKSVIVILVIGAGIIFAIPSIIYSENPSNWFLNNKVNLGLDLQGGSYLLLEVETDVLLKEELENISDTVRLISRNEKVNITNVIVEEDQIQFRFKNNSSIENIKNQFIKKYNYVKVVINKNIMKIIINDDFKKRIQEAALKQSLEIVRKRIDESGTKEPLIQRSGKKRILLQLPGVKDPERIKELLGTTAKLTFHMVDDEDTVSLKANKAPFGKIIVQDYINPEIKYLVEKKSRVGGENLVDAKASFDSNEYSVKQGFRRLTFEKKGALNVLVDFLTKDTTNETAINLEHDEDVIMHLINKLI